jgi:hypothetical protein
MISMFARIDVSVSMCAYVIACSDALHARTHSERPASTQWGTALAAVYTAGCAGCCGWLWLRLPATPAHAAPHCLCATKAADDATMRHQLRGRN